jgi:hypothetical protein
MNKNEYLYIPKKKEFIIVFFGGCGSLKGKAKINDTLPFEFSNFMSKNYENISRLFFVDYFQCFYSKGFFKKATTFDYCCDFIKKIIKDYKRVYFCGISSGGYAAILFGSVLKCNKVLAFRPQTNLNLLVKDGIISSHWNIPVDNIIPKHLDLNNIINKDTQYIVYGDKKVKDKKDYHHIIQCLNIDNYPNVSIIVDNPYLPNYKLMIKNRNLNEIFDDFILENSGSYNL